MKLRVVWLAALVAAAAITLNGGPSPHAADAAGSCLKFVNSRFDPTGNDNANLNAEWIRIRNTCSNARSFTGWRVTDFRSQNVYRFEDGFRLPAGGSVTLFSGEGNDTASRLYWGESREVWNNTDTEKAFLRNANGVAVSIWSESDSASPSSSASGGPSPSSSSSTAPSPSSSTTAVPSPSSSTTTVPSPSDTPDPSETPRPTY